MAKFNRSKLGLAESVDVFDAYIHEDVAYCESVDVVGGLKEARIYYCYLPFVSLLKLPNVIGSNEMVGAVTENILCVENRGFQQMKCLVDTSGLTSDFSGSSDVSELSGLLLENSARLIGFSRKARYRPFVFIVEDNNGKKFIVGNLVSPAYLKEFKLNSGKKYDDENGANFKIACNSIVYEYSGEIPLHEPIFGDFDSDFSTDFD